MSRFRHRWMPGVFIFLAVLLTGCATPPRALLQESASRLPPRAELAATPFFPQERYQCGPAALAMSLATAGIDVTPDALKPQVYVPQREGSLQPEMLAAARRNGAVAMTIPPNLDALLTELAAGHPVLVLQNLSLSWMPLWHYAVAIGYDLVQDEIILRSGTTERLTMPLYTFDKTWERGARWGMVTLSPGRLPATVEEASAVDALLAFEKTSDAPRARKAYAAALQRWPHNLALQLGLGNTAYAAGDRRAAAAAFRKASQEHPDNAPAFINLATVLLDLGEVKQARRAAESALALGGPWREAAATTLKAIEKRK
ncbi:peptidase C39 family protein [Herbaspirillum sp. HC18]|nr:peptidase C39 family protein [Herbaspirillum sp. HC18]